MKTNKIERAKAHLVPYDFRMYIKTLNLADLNEEERFYLKNYGIYNSKLRPESFTLRIRIAAGRITYLTLHTLVQIGKKYDLELLVTARAQLELHGLSSKNVLGVWELLQQNKLTTLQTFTDNFRNIVTDPYDGMDASSKIETFGLIEQMQDIFLDRPEWMGMLPRKFNTAICGTTGTYTHFFGNDLFFALASKKGEWGFNLFLGGKNSEVAQDADIFVTAKEVPLMFEAVAKAYRAYGLRGTRSKTRLFHLLEKIGIEMFVEYIAEFYPKTIISRGELHIEKASFSSYRKLADGSYGYCLQSKFGKVDIGRLEESLRYTKKENLEIRIGVDQNIYFLGLKEKSLPFASIQGASNVTACAGSHYCALSLWDIKSDTAYLPLEKIEKYQLQVGFSGCLKGCGRHHHCDIGLVGLRTNSFGQTQKAARVYLGGQYSKDVTPARLVFTVVPLGHLTALIEVIIEAYEESNEYDFERFSQKYLNPLSSGFVMLWFLSKLYLKEKIILEQACEEVLYQKLIQVPDFPFFEEDKNYLKSTDVMKHALWDDK